MPSDNRWADSAYRSKANETFLADNGFTSKIHRKKPQGRPMPKRTARANAKKSAVRARVEHVFAQQKDPMDLFVRTIGLARVELKVGMANVVYNIRRTLWLDRRAAPGLRPKPGKQSRRPAQMAEIGPSYAVHTETSPNRRPNPLKKR